MSTVIIHTVSPLDCIPHILICIMERNIYFIIVQSFNFSHIQTHFNRTRNYNNYCMHKPLPETRHSSNVALLFFF